MIQMAMTNAKKFAVTAFCAFTVTSILVMSYHRGVNVFHTEPQKDELFATYNGAGFTRDERHQLWASIFRNSNDQVRSRRLPDIVGLGIAKCGTGAMIHFLGQHPLVRLPKRVETRFFDKQYDRGLQFYKRIMPTASADELIMEKTPGYFFSANKIIDRIKKDIPNVKLIVSLCNPMKRAFSNFVHVHYGRHKDDNGTYFADAFRDATNRFVERYSGWSYDDIAKQCLKLSPACWFSTGIYHDGMQLWKGNFKPSQLLVLNGDTWLTDPGSLIEQIEEFLDIPPLLAREDFLKSPVSGFFCLNRWWNNTFKEYVHKIGETSEEVYDGELFCLGSGKGRTRNGVRSMHPETYEKLRLFYKPYNEMLYKVLGKNMGW